MSRATTQEFIVHAWRPMGGVERDPNAQFQEEEKVTVYASGRGTTVEKRIQKAIERTREILSLRGFDRFSASLTIADEEKRISAIEKELEEKADQVLEQSKEHEDHALEG